MFGDKNYSVTINTKSFSDQKIDPPAMSQNTKNHIDKNIIYFSRILGGHVTKHSDLTNQDMALLNEAYNKSHASKNFEIELYWKRATYAWALIAALITVCGLLINAYFSNEKNDGLIIISFVISIIGVLVTIVCNFIVQSGEHWKKNWEVHTALLEPLFSGHLYATHVVSSESRLSIAKLNNFLYMVLLCLWLLFLEFIIAVKFGSDGKTFACAIFIFFAFVFSYTLLINKTTTSKNDSVNVIVTGYSIKIDENELALKEKRNERRIFIFKSVLSFLLTGFSLLLMFLYFIENYSISKIFPLLAVW